MNLTKFLAAASIFAALAAPFSDAQAAVETSLNFVTPSQSGDPSDLSLFFSFDNQSTGDAQIKGDRFVDQFLFNVPETAAISFTAYSQFGLAGPGVSFSGFELVPANGEAPSYGFADSTVTRYFMSADGLSLDTGTYDLELTGSFLSGDGVYGGTVVATSAVPESAPWLLALVGLLPIAMSARRHSLLKPASPSEI